MDLLHILTLLLLDLDLVLVKIMISPTFEYIVNPSLRWSIMDNTNNMSRLGGPHTLTLAIVQGGVSPHHSTTQKTSTNQTIIVALAISFAPIITRPTRGMRVTLYSHLVSNDFMFWMSNMCMPHFPANSTSMF